MNQYIDEHDDIDEPAGGHEDDLLARVLDELYEPEAPAGLVRNVMNRVAAREGRPAAVFSGGVMSMAKKAMLGVAAAAAVILVVFMITGFPPVSSGTSGAIGAAKRAQAPQITASDVVTGDASAQQFLQSDEFAKLMADSNARKLLSNQAIQNALKDPAIVAAITSQGFKDMLANDLMKDALTQPALVSALKDTNFISALARDDFQTALSKGDLQLALSKVDMTASLTRNEITALFAQPGLMAALQTPAFHGGDLQPADRARLLEHGNYPGAQRRRNAARARRTSVGSRARGQGLRRIARLRAAECGVEQWTELRVVREVNAPGPKRLTGRSASKRGRPVFMYDRGPSPCGDTAG